MIFKFFTFKTYKNHKQFNKKGIIIVLLKKITNNNCMKNKIYFFLMILFPMFNNAQVGIKTEDPKSTLDVNGNVSIRQAPQITSLSGFQIMAINQGSSEVSQFDPSLLTAPNSLNQTVYSARKNNSISLLSLNLFSSWKQINFLTIDKTIGSVSLFSDADNSYNVPSTGIYLIGYYFRYGAGVQTTLLSGNPGMGILKKALDGVISVLDSREFTGINLGLASVTFTEYSMTSIYQLNEGEKLYFGLNNTGALGASLLSSSNASFYIYKISN